LRKALLVLFGLVTLGLFAVPARANNRAFGFCTIGSVVPTVSGLPLNNAAGTAQQDVLASYPGCQVNVYFTGTLIPATLYSDDLPTPTPLANPFSADANGYWFFYAASGRYDVTLSGAGYINPFTLADYPLTVGGGGGGAAPTLSTNGVVNFSQSALNLVNGSGIIITNTSAGNVSIAASNGNITNGQVGYGSLANTLTSDGTFLWNSTAMDFRIGPPSFPTLEVTGAKFGEPSERGVLSPGAVASINPNLNLTDNSAAFPFSLAQGFYSHLTTGLDGSSAANQEQVNEFQGDCTSHNGSTCVGFSSTITVDASGGQNSFGVKSALGASTNVAANLASGTAVGLEGLSTCVGANCQSWGAEVSSTCSGASCTSHGLDILNGGLAFNGSDGTSGNVPVSQGQGSRPIWSTVNLASSNSVSGILPVTNFCSATGASSSTFCRGDGTWSVPSVSNAWSAITAATNANAGSFILSGNTWDARIAAHTFPSVTVAAAGSLPGSCVSGELGFVTGATAGQNLYECNGGVWTQQLNSGAAGASTSLGNLAAVAINTTLLPAAVNTVALGSNTLPFTNLFLGPVANQAGSFNTANLTANRTVNLPDATSTPVRDCPAIANNVVTAIAVATGTCTQAQLATTNLSDVATIVTATSTTTKTNLTLNAESTGNSLSFPSRILYLAAGCNGTVTGPSIDIGVANQPLASCFGTTTRNGKLQFTRGNTGYLNGHLPKDWNSGANIDIEVCFTTTDTTNGHVTSFNIQTGFNKTDGTATDDPALNSQQALSITTGASQVSGGELCGSLTNLTTTGSGADYNFVIAATRNNTGTDTNTDTAVAVKSFEVIIGRTINATNR
jgi:hypothetical protein